MAERDELLDDFRRHEQDRAYFYADASLQALIHDLKTAKTKDTRINDRERAAARERLPRDWENVNSSQLAELESTLDDHLLRFRSPYPYDSRRSEMWFDGVKDGIRRAREEMGSDAEAQAWLERVSIDTTWGEASLRLMEGLGTILPNFYNGKRMMQWVSMTVRTDPTAEHYELVLSDHAAGLTLRQESRSVLPERAQEGLRETAIRFQNDNTFWRMAVAAVHQIDYTEDMPIFMKLSPAQIEFIKRVFANRDEDQRAARESLVAKIREKFPQKAEQLEREVAEWTAGDGLLYLDKDKRDTFVAESLLNWYAMSSDENKKRIYLAIMETLMVDGVKEKLTALERDNPDGSRGFDKDGLINLAKEVREKAEGKALSWHTKGIDIKDRLARVVAKMGIVLDWAQGSTSELYWGWNYKIKLEDDGTLKVDMRGSKVTGGTTTATDYPNMANFLVYYADTFNKAWTVGMLPPMSSKFVEQINEHGNRWKPGAPEAGKFDDGAQRAQATLLRSLEKLGWEDEAIKQLRSMFWYWETPIKNSKGDFIVMPMLFPAKFDSLNFWDTISLEKDRRIKEESPTIWDQLCIGEDISKLKWERMGDQALYRWMITIAQTYRFIAVTADPVGRETEDQFKAFFSSPANIRELLKRIDLAIRDEKESQSFLTLSIVPLLVVLDVTRRHNILGAGWQDNKEGWGAEISRWIVSLRNMPDESSDGKIKAYGQSLAAMTIFYAKLFARLSSAAYVDERSKVGDVYKKELSPELGEVGATLARQGM